MDIERIKNNIKTRHVSDMMLNVLISQLERDGYKKTEKYYAKRYKEVKKEQDSKNDVRLDAFTEILGLIDTLQKREGKL